MLVKQYNYEILTRFISSGENKQFSWNTITGIYY